MSVELWNDIPYLRDHAASINYFGLGFVQVKLNASQRLHYYHPELPTTVDVESVHNHRYNFTSRVIRGLLHQELFTLRPDILGTHVRRFESCQPGVEAPDNESLVSVERLADIWLFEGGKYALDYKTFHRVRAVGKTVTSLTRPEYYEVRFAEVVEPKNAERVCPFKTDLTEDELWAYAEDFGL